MKIDKVKFGKWIEKVGSSGLLLDNVGVIEFAKELSTIPEMKEFLAQSAADYAKDSKEGREIVGLFACIGTAFQLGFEVGAVWARPELEIDAGERWVDAKAN